jgi:1-deoxy-D-xylulose-5-phosphate reductoisomerase
LRLAIIGSTGSIGCSTIEVAADLGDSVEIVALAAGVNWEKLAGQCQELPAIPAMLAMAGEKSARKLEKALGLKSGTVAVGNNALAEMASSSDVDVVVTAMVGAEGLIPTLAAARAGKRIALANKEPLVAAGHLVMQAVAENNATLLPVDSEHSAVFQLINSGGKDALSRLVLCASGGPFRTWSAAQLAKVSVQDALKHPTWNMGPKITVDSATMMNKGLEVIEAHWLFDVDFPAIDVLVQPQSLVHAMVYYHDGTLLSHMGHPDMRTPIQYALTWPKRVARQARILSVEELSALVFEKPDRCRFPSIDLAYRAGRSGGTCGAVLNASNEVAVSAFIEGQIAFNDIPRLVQQALEGHVRGDGQSVEEILDADNWARIFVKERIV